MTYVQRMANREFGVGISEQEQKWWSTVLIFLNTFQVLEKKCRKFRKKDVLTEKSLWTSGEISDVEN